VALRVPPVFACAPPPSVTFFAAVITGSPLVWKIQTSLAPPAMVRSVGMLTLLVHGDKTFKSPFGSDNWSSVNLVKLSLHGSSLAEPCPGVLRTVHARGMTRAVKEHAKALAEATGKPLGVSAALRDIIGRGLKISRSRGERASFAEGVREGWLAAMVQRHKCMSFVAWEKT